MWPFRTLPAATIRSGTSRWRRRSSPRCRQSSSDSARAASSCAACSPARSRASPSAPARGQPQSDAAQPPSGLPKTGRPCSMRKTGRPNLAVGLPRAIVAGFGGRRNLRTADQPQTQSPPCAEVTAVGPSCSRAAAAERTDMRTTLVSRLRRPCHSGAGRNPLAGHAHSPGFPPTPRGNRQPRPSPAHPLRAHVIPAKAGIHSRTTLDSR